MTFNIINNYKLGILIDINRKAAHTPVLIEGK